MESALLLLELGLVVIGLALLARLAGVLRFSPIPLYLLAGLLLGEGGILPVVTAEEFIEAGAEIGVVLLLFMLGLEYSGSDLTSSLRSGIPSSLLDAGLNFTPGFVVGLVLGWSPLAAAFLGGVTYVSSSSVVAKLVGDLGWVGNGETPTVLTILVMEDLAMAVYLPVMAAVVAGSDAVSASLSVTGAVVAVAVILTLAVRYGPAISRLVFSRSDEAVLLAVFGSILVVAGIAEQLRVSAAVGAFLAGIALSGPAADRARDLLTPLRDLFGAVFFVFFGLRLDPASIPAVLVPAAGLAFFTVPTKVVTGWLAARWAGIGSRGRRRAGAALVARGEFSVAIAALAVTAGVEPELAPVTAVFVLLTATVGPLGALVAGALPARLREPREVGPPADRT